MMRVEVRKFIIGKSQEYINMERNEAVNDTWFVRLLLDKLIIK